MSRCRGELKALTAADENHTLALLFLDLLTITAAKDAAQNVTVLHSLCQLPLMPVPVLVHGQVTIIFVVSVSLFVCAEFFSAVFDPISIKLGHMLYVWV